VNKKTLDIKKQDGWLWIGLIQLSKGCSGKLSWIWH